MRRTLAVLPLAVVMIAGVAGCGSGGSSSSTWSHLRTVQISVAQPSVAPPGGAPNVTSFTSAAEIATVTRQLNAHHIAAAGSQNSAGCTGGFMIEIEIVNSSGKRSTLSTYRCGEKTYGGIAGDLPGFISAVGAGSV
jgi:hypothetical protein